MSGPGVPRPAPKHTSGTAGGLPSLLSILDGTLARPLPASALAPRCPWRAISRDARTTSGFCPEFLAVVPNLCSSIWMSDAPLPQWWTYPARCGAGHAWGPGKVIVSWQPCQCGPARAALAHGSGHRTIACRAPGCRYVCYEPPHEPEPEPGAGATLAARPAAPARPARCAARVAGRCAARRRAAQLRA